MTTPRVGVHKTNRIESRGRTIVSPPEITGRVDDLYGLSFQKSTEIRMRANWRRVRL
jgi:hypothetical protein